MKPVYLMMSTYRFCLIIVLSLFVITCNRKKVRVNPPPDEVVDTSVINRTPVQLDTIVRVSKIFRGLYTFGNEISIFRDCNTGKVYWVTDSTGNINRMYAAVKRYPAYPYESIYAEVRGYLNGKSKMGYASEYENELIVNDVLKTEVKNFRTECYPYEFIALGNEPFWSIDIIPAEDRIVLKDAGEGKVYEFPYEKPSGTNGEFEYQVNNSQKDRLVLTIRKSTCSDGMSDREYLYAASVTINGKLLQGCAIRKGDQFQDNP